MSDSAPTSWRHQLTFRVQYHETDGQRRVHHSNYLRYFEQGRVEMLREAGISYKSIEDEGLLLVVTELNSKFSMPAEFDDELTLTTKVTEIGKVRIRHHYRIDRDGETIVEADSTIACINQAGKPCRLPQRFFRK